MILCLLAGASWTMGFLDTSGNGMSICKVDDKLVNSHFIYITTQHSKENIPAQYAGVFRKSWAKSAA